MPLHVARRPRGSISNSLTPAGTSMPVTNDAAREPVEWRTDRRVAEMCDREILEYPRSDLDRRVPAAGIFRPDETLLAATADAARHAVPCIRRPGLKHASHLTRPGFDGGMAIGTTTETRTHADR
jgi:hypothetical protein